MDKEATLSLKELSELRLNAPRDTISTLLKLIAGEDRSNEGARFRIEDVKHKFGPALSLRADTAAGSGSIGLIFLLSLGDGRTLLRVPNTSPERDPDGRLFSLYLQTFHQEMRRLGLITARSRFDSAKVLDTAVRQLASAEDSPGYAAVGPVCRAALIALADEVYEPYMLPPGKNVPKGDEADTKLGYAAHHYAAAHSKRQGEGLDKVINGSWDFAQALTHRKNAPREDAQVCVTLTAAVFDSFALMVPNG